MRPPLVLAISLLSLATASCLPVRRDNDTLCSEIVRFANSTAPGETQDVVFLTTWGFSTVIPDSFGSKACEEREGAPARRLCDYLLAHSSTEFAEANFSAVLACMTGDRERLSRKMTVKRMDTLMWAREMKGVREDVAVGVEFVTGDWPKLRIIAEAFEPE